MLVSLLHPPGASLLRPTAPGKPVVRARYMVWGFSQALRLAEAQPGKLTSTAPSLSKLGVLHPSVVRATRPAARR